MNTIKSWKDYLDGDDSVVSVVELKDDGTAILIREEFSPTFTAGIAHGFSASPASEKEGTFVVEGSFRIQHDVWYGQRRTQRIVDYIWDGDKWSENLIRPR
jgi:hypothetical protein